MSSQFVSKSRLTSFNLVRVNTKLEVQISSGRAAFKCEGSGISRFEVIVFDLTYGHAILRARNDHQFPMTYLGQFVLTKDNLYIAEEGILYCARFAI